MQQILTWMPANRFTAVSVFAALCLALSLGFSNPAQAGDEATSDEAATEPKADKAVVVPYETRSRPTHRVDLRDDRVYFLKKLEQNGDMYVLHTLEDEVIEVEASEIAKIVEFKEE